MDRYTLYCEETILLVIDIQEKLIPAMNFGKKVIKQTSILLTIADQLGIPTIITEQYPKGLGHTVPEIENLMEERDQETSVIEKITFSGCTEELKTRLAQTGKSKVVVTGMETHVCVFQTVRDLLASDYQVFVAKDAVCSRTKENYRNGLTLMDQMGAVITNTETVFFDLMKEASSPEFKELSKLIK